MQLRQKYQELLEVCKKHKNLNIGEVDKVASIVKARLWAVELEEKYGIVTDHSKFYNGGSDYVNLNEYVGIFKYGEGTRRSIAWSDDGRQPGDEYLVKVGFSTGAYIFGEDYPTNIFQEFWHELKTYNPDYCDTRNNGLYWKLENASKIVRDFDSILQKYKEKNREDFKRRRAEKLRKELEELKN